jgi:putative transposase
MVDRTDIAFRPSTRLRGFDYLACYAYFVTVCLTDRLCVFGSISNDQVSFSRRGQIARDCWLDIPNHHPHVELDVFVVMPNHIHGILRFEGDAPGLSPVVATPASRSTRTVENMPIPTGAAAGSLGAVIGSYKSAVTRTINRHRPGAGTDMWQRNFYDHIIRTDRALDSIRDYIVTNPLRWLHDSENPDGDGADELEAFIRQVASREISSLRDERDAGVATTGDADAR